MYVYTCVYEKTNAYSQTTTTDWRYDIPWVTKDLAYIYACSSFAAYHAIVVVPVNQSWRIWTKLSLFSNNNVCFYLSFPVVQYVIKTRHTQYMTQLTHAKIAYNVTLM